MQQRNIVTCVILSIVTCGIYQIFWMISLNDDARTASGDASGTTGGMVFLLSLVTCGIYGIYWMYVQGNRIDAIKTNSGFASSNTGVLYIVLSIVGLGFINYCLMQSELNKVY